MSFFSRYPVLIGLFPIIIGVAIGLLLAATRS